MKIFVAGSTGVVGRRVVALMVANGHTVTGIARTPERADQLRALGVRGVAADLFDRDSLRGFVEGSDVVINLSTHIPPPRRAAFARNWRENDRLRIHGSANLVDVARDTGAKRFIQESICFGYVDAGSAWIDEDTLLAQTRVTASSSHSEAHALAFTSESTSGVVLRFGSSYAADSLQTQYVVRAARRGLGLIVGTGEGFSSNVHVDDAATAVVAALSVESGVYNVVEDESLRRREQLEILAHALDRKKLWSAGAAMARLGGPAVAAITRSQRISNKRFCAASHWRPTFPSVREGWPEVVSALRKSRL